MGDHVSSEMAYMEPIDSVCSRSLSKKAGDLTTNHRSIVRLLLLASVISLIHIAIYLGSLNCFWYCYVGEFVPQTAQLWFVLPEVFTINLLVLAALIGGTIAFKSFTQRKELELKSSVLESQLSQAKLDALQKQLQPHFLFNALNALNTLILREDLRQAELMLNRISLLLRETIDAGKTQWSTLENELTIARLYLDIHEVRFGKRLSVEYDIPEDTISCMLPGFILQPYIENAIKHGISKTTGIAKIEIAAYCADKLLNLKISDNGPGIDPDTIIEGVGLKNTRKRISEIYGKRASVEYQSPADGGFVVLISLPCRTQ
jgi:two-component system LytT family sensor kinase